MRCSCVFDFLGCVEDVIRRQHEDLSEALAEPGNTP